MQASLSAPELRRILDAVPEEIPICFDITQSLCNVPINWGEVIRGHEGRVFLLGSFVKHGRCGEGVGFLVHPESAAAQVLIECD